MSESKSLRSWTDDDNSGRQLPPLSEWNDSQFSEARRRFELVTRDLHSWIDAELLWSKLKSGSRVQIYWGTATTGRPHLGYFVPMLKLADFLAAGCDVKVLFADLHGFLDNMKSSWDVLEHRCAYYTFIIRAMLRLLQVDVDGGSGSGSGASGKLEFVRGSSYQLGTAFTLDVYKMSVCVTTGDTTRAGAEVVKQTATPLMSNLLYPILQALDEEHLGADIQFGGVDQRKIFMFSREHISKLGYRKRAYLMNPLIPGLGKSGKMSSSEPLSKIDFDDSRAALASKIRKSFCPSPADFPGDAQQQEECMTNGLLAICKFILFRWLDSKPDTKFVVKDVVYRTFDELAAAFRSGAVYPTELKAAVEPLLELMLGPIRDLITDPAQEGTQLLLRAYPEVGDARKREAQMEAARLKGPTTIAAANVVVGVIAGEPQPVDGAPPGVRRVDVDVGSGVRLVCISPLVPADAAKGRRVAVLRNAGTKLFHVAGQESTARLLYVQAKDGAKHLLDVPADAGAGEVISCDGVDGEPVDELKGNWSKIAAKLATSAAGVPCWNGTPLSVSGVVLPAAAAALADCQIECDEREKPAKADKADKAPAAPAAASASASSSAAPAKKKPAAGANENKPLDVSRLALVVGRIVDVKVHPDADSLYIEQIDVGEASGPRTIVSGLRKHIPIEEMRDRLVVVVANLKPANLKSVKSFGMVLCGANADRTVIEFLEPPAGSKVGEPLVADSFAGEPDEQIDVKKDNNPWTAVQPDLRVNAAKEGTYKGVPLKTSAGVCVCKTLTSCPLS
jgi:tyrosyl-tRNA synthetase